MTAFQWIAHCFLPWNGQACQLLCLRLLVDQSVEIKRAVCHKKHNLYPLYSIKANRAEITLEHLCLTNCLEYHLFIWNIQFAVHLINPYFRVYRSLDKIKLKFLHITQFTVCAAKNLTVFVADSPRCLEWSSMVAAVSRALRELSEPCLGWTREPRGQTKSLGARRQFSQATVNNVLPVMTGSPAFLTQPPPAGFDCLGQHGECFSLKYNNIIILAPICPC